MPEVENISYRVRPSTKVDYKVANVISIPPSLYVYSILLLPTRSATPLAFGHFWRGCTPREMSSSLVSSIRSLRRLCRFSSLRVLLTLFLIWAIFDVLQKRFWLPTPITERERTLQGQPKIFVASIHWNTEAILRQSWNNAVIDLAKAVGPDNIFISIYESGSFDDSKGALRELGRALDVLGVAHNITLSETTHLNEISQKPEGTGWIRTPRGRDELRRIP